MQARRRVLPVLGGVHPYLSCHPFASCLLLSPKAMVKYAILACKNCTCNHSFTLLPFPAPSFRLSNWDIFEATYACGLVLVDF